MVATLLRLFLILLFTSSVFAQQISVKAITDSSDYLIGDHINYTLTISHSDEVGIVAPFFRDSLARFEIIKEFPVEKAKADGKNLLRYKYILSYFDSSEVTIPPIKIFYRTKNDTALQSVQSDSIQLKIHKVSVKVEEDIKDIKPPIRIPFDLLSLLIWILVAIAILVSAYLIYKKYFRKKPAEEVIKPEIILPPHEEALMKLDQLEREQLWQKGFVKDYHSRITEIIRVYFEKRFNLPALELTTSEQLEYLKLIPEAKEILNITESFLSNADLVKFAKFVPMDGVNAEMMKQAIEIVNRTAQKLKTEQGVEQNVQ
ncbi:hypothetical protein [Ignavibacterium sp.]|uniref:hypothetical protein n=1 Tax=Ignavibacterium sp. TaxID=2651167 RepID=UPI00307ECEF7